MATSTKDDMFKRATNRTFCDFEKEDNLEWKGPFRFIQAADTQFGLIDELKAVNWNGPIEKAVEASKAYKALGNSTWTEEIRLAELAIHQWNRMSPKPAFVTICGDLVNDYPGEKQRGDQVRDFKHTFSQLDSKIPLVLLPGNHDLLNKPNPEAVEAYKADFGDDYFSFAVNGVFFLVINVQYYKDPSLVADLAAEHDRWIDRQLEEVKGLTYKHVIVFQHIPWFLRDVDEPEDAIFNIALDERKRMVSKFSAAGVRAIFAGHYHRNAGGHFEEMELVVTSAMGAVMKDPLTGLTGLSGYRVVDVEETHLKHSFVEIEGDDNPYANKDFKI